MEYIVIDTCVWIEIVSKPPLHPLLAATKDACGPTRQLVVPSSVKVEFNRNRDATSVSFRNSLKGHRSAIAPLKSLLPHVSDELSRIDAAATELSKLAETQVHRSIADADELFSAAFEWTHAPAHEADACRRCLSVLPPAQKQNRTSVGDCLLWSCVLDLLNKGDVWFCSQNQGDFSDDRRFDQLHPALKEEAAHSAHELRYFNSPSVMLETLQQTQPSAPASKGGPGHYTRLPSYYDFVDAPPKACASCGKGPVLGVYLPSQYGGLTWQFLCSNCGARFDTGDAWD